MSTAPLWRRHVLFACAASLSFVTATAAAAPVMQVDQVSVYSDGTLSDWIAARNVWFTDHFDNGTPNIGPQYKTSADIVGYTVYGTSAHPELVSESGGKLRIDPSLSDRGTGPTGVATQGAGLRLNTDVGDPNGVLSISRTFAVSATFDLDALPGPGQNFGIRLSDGFSNRDNFLELNLTRDHGIAWQRHDYLNGTTTTYGWIQMAIPTEAEGVKLFITHETAGSTDVRAGWAFTDAAGERISPLLFFGAYGTAFTGESTTQFAVRSMQLMPAVPEPATSALMALGGLAVAAAARRRRA